MWAALWAWLKRVFRREPKGILMTITATATLTTSGAVSAPKLGDVLDYRVAITGDTESITIAATPVTVTVPGQAAQTLTPLGGPWVFTIADIDDVPAPTVTGPLTKPFTADPADPRHWTATI